MGADRLRQLVLAALVVVLGAVLYRAWPRPAEPGAPPSNRGAAAPASKPASQAATAPDVRLEALEAERAEPGDSRRNLFRFQPKAPPPPPPPLPGAGGQRPAEGRGGPPPPPAVEPIPLRFIGFVKDDQGTLAALVDDRGAVHHGREGDTIEGRWTITRVGVESIEMTRVDGTGRQTIPLSNR